ncbi:hypothetical protein PISMIDRAFT_656350 [Pisolithus microcarpus 441]|uniref:Uncharacterized protein n=1 Tax=Pisolithus microcarpus 441 TaxID=765257 RepID=A0A0C9Y7G7_9AGAM|nr:hypothetical protein BKA83DRAFT_656350 [Pisolithus microcarpus]KIK20620.1 hypothetical protein PISMIDRAFT_656350 [Pisolithus microcarpus 441]
MVMQNIEMDLDITNGARGAIVDIVLHADEPPMTPINGIVCLQNLPIFLLVKLNRMQCESTLDTCVIPVEPVCKSHCIHYKTSEGSDATHTVKWHQFPMTSAYAFTDYHAQGQTLPYVIVDIAKLPSGGLNLFNLYVALSRSSGQEMIRLLRDFEDTLFKSTHAADLLAEDNCLLLLDGEMVAWWSHIAVSKAL